MRSRRLVALGVVLLSFLGACAGDDDKPTAEKETAPQGAMTTSVAVKDFVFAPEAIRVKSGATVTWTNEDDFDHSVLIDSIDLVGANFGPQTMPLTFSHRFAQPGTYAYICGVHNSMTGTVIVTD